MLSADDGMSLAAVLQRVGCADETMAVVYARPEAEVAPGRSLPSMEVISRARGFVGAALSVHAPVVALRDAEAAEEAAVQREGCRPMPGGFAPQPLECEADTPREVADAAAKARLALTAASLPGPLPGPSTPPAPVIWSSFC
jgi:hypothetical protein